MDIKLTKKLYIDNPYLKEASAKIIDKSFKDKKYLIKLDRTIFSPHISEEKQEDFGTIDGVDVIDVYKYNNDLIHVVEEDIKNKEVLLTIDWKNRFDSMQNHTGKHILSAAFKKLFNINTLDFNLGEGYMTIDSNILDIDEDKIFQIEVLSNKIIQSNFKVSSKFLNDGDMNKLGIQKNKKSNEKTRVINIDNIDVSPCYSSHLSNTGEVGLIKIISFERYKSSTRVSLICGNRALEDYSFKNKYLTQIAEALSSNVPDALKDLLKLKENIKDIEAENQTLKEEIISLKGETLLEKKKTLGNIDYIVKNLGSMDKEEIDLISSYLDKNKNLIQIYKLEKENSASFLISKSDNLNIDLKKILDIVSEKIIVKGEGDKNRIQGSSSVAIIDRVIEMFFKEIKKYFIY